MVEQAGCVVGHLGERVGRVLDPSRRELADARHVALHRRRLAYVAIVEADHEEPAPGQLAAEVLTPGDHLCAQTHDQQDRRVTCLAEGLVTERDRSHFCELFVHMAHECVRRYGPVIGGVAYTTCPLCEATCGLELQLDDDGRVTRARGDKDDVFSQGFICPKGGSITALHEDPDRVRTPLVRRDGELVEATWDEAFAEIERRLPPILEQHGRNSVGVYLGNPSVHNLSFTLYGRVLLKALGTRNIFSASTVDQMPKQVSSGLMFGTFLSIPIPDIDRTDYMLILGANPLASNGSLMTAPDYRGRLRALRARGGKVVVIDPRRSRTAENADEHHFIRPGADAFFLAALAREIFESGLADLGEVAEHVEGVERARELVAPFDAERAAAACGIPADDIRRIARELA